MHAYTLVNVRIALLNPAQSARSAPLNPGKLKQEGFKINFIVYTRTPATPGPAHAHQFSSVQFSSVQFSSVGAAAEVETGGRVTAERRGCRCLGAPPVDLLRLDARRKFRRKRPDALADQTRAVAGDPV